jgi:hypothetical protein
MDKTDTRLLGKAIIVPKRLIDPYELNDEQFKATLADRTTPDQVFANAPRIYEYMGELFGTNCGDSVLREWSFQWWSDKTGKSYDTIYERWLSGAADSDTSPLTCPACGNAEHLQVAAKVWVKIDQSDPDNIETTDAYQGHDWDDDSAACCTSCHWVGPAGRLGPDK